MELLRPAKEFFKARKGDPDRPIPDEIATVLYFAIICVALTRCETRISQLDDNALRLGFQWVLDQPWVDDRTLSLLRQGLACLG